MSASAEILERFERLLAPQAEIHVFFNVRGLAFDSVRMPGTKQLILGLSVELYNAVSRHIFEQTGRQIRREVTTRIVFGRDYEEVLVPRPVSIVESEEISAQYVSGERLYLRPKPI